MRAADLVPTMHDKIGQMIMIGFHGTSADDPRFKDAIRQLEEGVIGGVLFLPHNIETRSDLMRMTAAVRACKCRHTPLVAVDQEGGRIQRLGPQHGFSGAPSAKAVAAQGDAAEARKIYDALARQVAEAGFNMNFAPVVDVDLNPQNPIIGWLERSFSADPAVVHRFARIFIESHHAAGVLTSLKHFPGHGSSITDTHTEFADVTGLWDSEAELHPYRGLIADGLVDSIMVGHISHDQWGGLASQAPATAISRILRRDLGYGGVVVTDDLEMDAVLRDNPDFTSAILRAVRTGADTILVSNFKMDRPQLGNWIHNVLIEAQAHDAEIDSAIADAFPRIQAMKAQLSTMQRD